MLERRRFEAGETIVREDDFGETAYIIEQGSAEIRKRVGGKDVPIARLGPGETIGEMSMIDDKPRSASAIALEATEVREIHHDDFYESLQTDPQMTLLLLKALFERLREANATIAQMQSEQAAGGPPGEALPAHEQATPRVVLEGLTPEALGALPESPSRIDRFPFRVGRTSHNPLVHNDLTLEDQTPWQISRHHMAFVLHQGQVGVVDRGSGLGTAVNGERIGGRSGATGPVLLPSDGGEIVLGNEKSPYRFQVRIETEASRS